MQLEVRTTVPRPAWQQTVVRRVASRHGIRILEIPATNGQRILDLTDHPAPGAWQVRYDGVPGPAQLTDAIGRGHLPLVEVVDPNGEVVAAGRPGTEQPGRFEAALDDVAVGVGTLVGGALVGQQFAAPAPSEPDPANGHSAARGAARRLARAAAYPVYRALYRTPHWRVGWRWVDEAGDGAGRDVLDLLDHPDGGWHDLPDDRRRFYADPFPFVHEGRAYVFVEDFDHRSGKGVISVVEYDEHGPVGAPRTVLTHDVHLSYPFVLAHAGEVWMVPETSAAGTIELYRASSFPDTWVLDSVLVDGVEASDATPFRYGGRWWLSATVREGGSFSDALHLWSAPDLRGPWQPHTGNPVLVDIASARPAGRVVERDGRLLRPAQDGRRGYGAALTIAEVTRLDDEAFEQRVVAALGPTDRWPGRRLHTLNRAGNLEVIDGSGMAPRLWRGRKGR